MSVPNGNDSCRERRVTPCRCRYPGEKKLNRSPELEYWRCGGYRKEKKQGKTSIYSKYRRYTWHCRCYSMKRGECNVKKRGRENGTMSRAPCHVPQPFSTGSWSRALRQ